MRAGTVLTAFGMERSGSSASDPATPMISVPPKANSTRMKDAIMPWTPLGKKPPSFQRLLICATSGCCPRLNTRIAAPPMIIATTAVTLMMVNANSSSPNQRTVARLAAPMMSKVTAIHTHAAVSGNQNFM